MTVKDYIDIEVEGINTGDAPDFCDAYISSATAVLEDGSMRDATEKEIESLNDDGELVYGCVIARIY